MSDTDSTYSLTRAQRDPRPSATSVSPGRSPLASSLELSASARLPRPSSGWKDWPSAGSHAAGVQPARRPGPGRAGEGPQRADAAQGRPSRPRWRLGSGQWSPGRRWPRCRARTTGGLTTFIADPTSSGPSTRAEREQTTARTDGPRTTSTQAPAEGSWAPPATFQADRRRLRSRTASRISRRPRSARPTRPPARRSRASPLACRRQPSSRSAAVAACGPTPTATATSTATTTPTATGSRTRSSRSSHRSRRRRLNGDRLTDGLDNHDGDGFPDVLPVPPAAEDPGPSPSRP